MAGRQRSIDETVEHLTPLLLAPLPFDVLTVAAIDVPRSELEVLAAREGGVLAHRFAIHRAATAQDEADLDSAAR